MANTAWERFRAWLGSLFGGEPERQTPQPEASTTDTNCQAALERIGGIEQRLRKLEEGVSQLLEEMRKPVPEPLPVATPEETQTGIYYRQFLQDGRRGATRGFATWLEERGKVWLVSTLARTVLESDKGTLSENEQKLWQGRCIQSRPEGDPDAGAEAAAA